MRVGDVATAVRTEGAYRADVFTRRAFSPALRQTLTPSCLQRARRSLRHAFRLCPAWTHARISFAQTRRHVRAIDSAFAGDPNAASATATAMIQPRRSRMTRHAEQRLCRGTDAQRFGGVGIGAVARAPALAERPAAVAWRRRAKL